MAPADSSSFQRTSHTLLPRAQHTQTNYTKLLEICLFFMLLLLPNGQCSSVPNRLTGLTVNGSSLKEEQIRMTVEAMREGKAQRKTESRTCTARERERQRERERGSFRDSTTSKHAEG